MLAWNSLFASNTKSLPKHIMKQNCKIMILPDGRFESFPEGTILLNALNSMGIALASPCGGKGICGKCSVEISGETNLACRTNVTDDISINLIIDNNVINSSFTKTTSAVSCAIDIGTTTIEISLLDLYSKKQTAYASIMNPQRRYGYDVISTIAAARDPQVRKNMTSSLRASIAHTINSLLSKTGASKVHEIYVSGNTTMSYLFAGLDLSPLAGYPYALPQQVFEPIDASSAGFDITGNTKIFILPVISAFIGGDIAGAIVLTESMDISDNIFFVDIGTNGEMFLKTGSGDILALSCAMGPALEGMNISMGMTASAGAVVHVNIKDNALETVVMNNDTAKGFAGTGIIDLVAIMLKNQIIHESGAFNADINTPFSNAALSAEGLKLNNGLILTQKDIRAIQLAKGACRSGAAILLKEAGFATEDIKFSVIAGSLGNNLNTGNFATLGFLPPFTNAQSMNLGNTSLATAEKCCLDPKFYDRILEVCKNVKVIDAANHPYFTDCFMSFLDFQLTEKEA